MTISFILEQGMQIIYTQSSESNVLEIFPSYPYFRVQFTTTFYN